MVCTFICAYLQFTYYIIYTNLCEYTCAFSCQTFDEIVCRNTDTGMALCLSV